MRLKIKNITRLLIKAHEKQSETSAWELYLTKYPQMTEDTFIPFEDFYNKKRTVIRDKTEEEILNEVKEILDTFNERR